MVIQRWQSLFLLIAAILMGVLCTMPMAAVTAADGAQTTMFVKDAPVLLTVNLVVAALLLVAIFMYNNLKRQMTVTLMSILLIAVSAVTGGIILYKQTPEAELMWLGGTLLLTGALIFAISAYKRMQHDQRLLRSYDRLR